MGRYLDASMRPNRIAALTGHCGAGLSLRFCRSSFRSRAVTEGAGGFLGKYFAGSRILTHYVPPRGQTGWASKRGIEMNWKAQITITAAAIALLVGSPERRAAALTCDQFKAGLAEGAKIYGMPAPRYEPGPALYDGALPWGVTGQGNKAMLVCTSDGHFAAHYVGTPNGDDLHQVLAALQQMGAALHAYGLPWREALTLRDELVAKVNRNDGETQSVRLMGQPRAWIQPSGSKSKPTGEGRHVDHG
jgi:hypothetical protein